MYCVYRERVLKLGFTSCEAEQPRVTSIRYEI